MKLRQLSEIKYGWILFIVDFILPLPLTGLMIYLWFIRTHNWPFSLFVIILPLLFGYIVPGIGTNILKLWTFKWRFMKMGNYFIHHGFMYAPYLSLSLYITFGYWEHLSIYQALTITIPNAFLQCFLTTWHDYWAVKSGMIEINNRPFREGKSAAEIILDYGPIGYALFGFTFAITCLFAYHYFITLAFYSITLFILLLGFGLFIMGFSGLHYVLKERKNSKYK